MDANTLVLSVCGATICLMLYIYLMRKLTDTAPGQLTGLAVYPLLLTLCVRSLLGWYTLPVRLVVLLTQGFCIYMRPPYFTLNDFFTLSRVLCGIHCAIAALYCLNVLPNRDDLFVLWLASNVCKFYYSMRSFDEFSALSETVPDTTVVSAMDEPVDNHQ